MEGTWLYHLQEASRINPGLLDNYNWRTHQARDVLTAQVWPDFQLVPGRTGIDGFTTTFKDIEMKSGGDGLRSGFMWDKQNDPVRREATLASDAFTFSWFSRGNVTMQGMLVAKDNESVENIRNLLRTAQERRVRVWNQNVAQGRRGGWDGVTLKLNEILARDGLIYGLYHQGEYSEMESQNIRTTLAIA
jgi:hypothetical protein